MIDRIPLLRDLYHYSLQPLTPWTLNLGGAEVSVQAPRFYVRRFEQDARKGRFTGIDAQGRYEYAFAEAFRQQVRPDTVLYDVGAAYGIYTRLALQDGAARVVAFEPSLDARAVFDRNRFADKAGPVKADPRPVGKGGEAGVVSIDEAVAEGMPAPTLVKMDIEGYEFYALQGMRETLAKHRPVVLLEFHERKMRRDLHVEPGRCLDPLREAGYRLSYNGHHWHTARTEGQVDEKWHESPPNDINYAIVAVPG